jgi:hypothetical protein
VAATVPVEKAGDVNPLLEAAQQIGDPVGENSQTNKKDADAPADNGDGSFERFMSTFGNPTRWAGRS